MSIKDFFLSDIEEMPIPQEAAISGNLPNWLRGSYYKIANGKYTLASGFQMNHLFDGFALIYHYEIDDNKIRFKSKYLNSSAYKEAMEFGKPTYPELGTRHFSNPNQNLVARTINNFLPFDVSDNCFANIFTYNDKIFVNNESCFLHQIDPDSLESIAKVDLRKVGIQFTTGHYLSGKSGALYNCVATAKFGILKVAIVQFTPPLINEGDANDDLFDVEKYKVIASKAPRSMTTISPCHSFGMSENYFVVIEQPIKVNLLMLALKLIRGKTLLDSFSFNSNEKTRFTIVDRSTGNILKTKFETIPFFFVHVVNTFEDDGCLVIDIITYKNADYLLELQICKLRSNDFNLTIKGIIKRFVIPINNIQTAEKNENLVKLNYTTATAVKVDNESIFSQPEELFDIPVDVVRFNENFKEKKYRFGYSFVPFYNHKFQKHLIKFDFVTKEIKTWKSDNEAHFACEPMFVPNPDGVDEDNGIVIAVIAEPNKKYSALVFLDAKLFVEIARAEFTCQVNLGNHGLFVFNKQTTKTKL